MVGKEALGALVMSTVAVLDTAVIVSNRILQEQQWPAMRFMAAACCMVATFLAAGLALSKSTTPTLQQSKWILLRGVCGTATVILEILAIRAGISAGDLSALTSINTVFSAIFGRIFLGEELQIVHAVALVMSLLGATLMSRPGPLAVTASSGMMSIAGFVFATSSGFTTASLFICSRKSSSVSPWYLCFSTAALGAPLFWVVSLTPVVDDFSFEPIMRHPSQAIAILLLLSLLSLLTILCVSTGAQWCPAMVSATVSTGSRMVGGYIAQIVFFDTVPDAISLIGAILLFASVIIVALARVREPSSPAASQAQSTEANTDASASKAESSAEAACVDQDEESLAHFVASEFAEFEPHQQPLRQRRASKIVRPGVQVLGVEGLAITA